MLKSKELNGSVNVNSNFPVIKCRSVPTKEGGVGVYKNRKTVLKITQNRKTAIDFDENRI